MIVYAITVEGKLQSDVHTSLKGVADCISKPSYKTLQRQLAVKDIFEKEGLIIQRCHVVKVKGRGHGQR